LPATASTARADLLFFRHVVLVADLRQLVPVDLALLAVAAVAAHVDFVFGETLSPSAIRPTLVPRQFVECGVMQRTTHYLSPWRAALQNSSITGAASRDGADAYVRTGCWNSDS
jgi:hypothetical protein